ncbi:MAG TPA: hypothetical protein VMU11_04365 [Verrucomicrobiae bacterium]|nr:hypothetical protein [Verrucomicrobiae bacterium]
MKHALGSFLIIGIILTGAGCMNTAANNAPPKTPAEARVNPDGSISQGVNTYYKVSATDPDGNTGNKVCARVGKKCVGFTDETLSTCLAFHPDAASVSDLDGAKAGFYCDGPPEGGVCAREKNTCHICPECNLNMECDTQAGTLYREMFVQCK